MKLKSGFSAILLSATLISCDNKPNTALYSGKDISNDAEVMCSKTTKETTINVDVDGKWQLFTGKNAESIDFSKPILTGEGAGVFPIETGEQALHAYVLETDNGRAAFSAKLLPMEGGFNFRDLGGIKTTDERFVKWGKVFRADELGNLTQMDWNYLATIPLVSIVDFRSMDEVSAKPDNAPKFVKNQFHLQINPGNLTSMGMDFLNDPSFDSEKFMEDLNIQLVSDSTIISQYRQFFRILQNPDSIPLAFHCTAGKDRTGMGAALFLYSLGVDEQTIMSNYMESNINLKEKYKTYIEQYPAMEGLFSVKSQYLESGINYIKQNYGSVEKYLTEALEVDIKLMKKLYLY